MRTGRRKTPKTSTFAPQRPGFPISTQRRGCAVLGVRSSSASFMGGSTLSRRLRRLGIYVDTSKRRASSCLECDRRRRQPRGPEAARWSRERSMLMCPPTASGVYASRTARTTAVSFSVSPRALWLMHSAAKRTSSQGEFRPTVSVHPICTRQVVGGDAAAPRQGRAVAEPRDERVLVASTPRHVRSQRLGEVLAAEMTARRDGSLRRAQRRRSMLRRAGASPPVVRAPGRGRCAMTEHIQPLRESNPSASSRQSCRSRSGCFQQRVD